MSEETEKTKVLLVGSRTLIHIEFRMVLETCDDTGVMDEAADGKIVLGMVRVLRPNAVLIDVRMPNMNGIEATGETVSENPEMKVLILTTPDLDEHAPGVLHTGAPGFLLKDAKPEGLVTVVRAVAAGNATISPRITKKVPDIFALQLPNGDAGASATGAETTSADVVTLASLTKRETKVLKPAAHGMANQELADKLFTSMTTVKTYVGNILNKIGAHDRVQVVVFACENDLVN